MKSPWRAITRVGVEESLPAPRARYIIITNQAALLVACICLVQPFSPVMQGAPGLQIVGPIQAISYLAVLLLNYLGRHHAATMVFALLATINIAILSVLGGERSETHLYLMTVALGAWFFFPPSRWRAAGLLNVLVLMVFVGLQLAFPGLRHLAVIPEDKLAMAAQINQSVLFVLVVAFARYFGKNASAAEAHLEEARARSDGLLLNILPRQIAERLKSNPASIAERFDEVTVLFADIVNFTTLAERLPAARLVEILDTIFSQFDALADKWGVEKIKTIGDAYMVAGGIPERKPGHLDAIASMALDMQRIMKTLAQPDGETLSIRIGIATGPVIAGVIGNRKFVYDLWGDCVNTASRMESHGQPGRIHVTQQVFDQLKDRFVFEARGLTAIKGKGDLNTFFLEGSRTLHHR